MTFADRMSEERRLVLLRLLSEAPGYTGNESMLHAGLDYWGFKVSRDLARTDLAWLGEQELVTLTDLAGLQLAVITDRGLDVANGNATCPGVKRPGPRRRA